MWFITATWHYCVLRKDGRVKHARGFPKGSKAFLSNQEKIYFYYLFVYPNVLQPTQADKTQSKKYKMMQQQDNVLTSFLE